MNSKRFVPIVLITPFLISGCSKPLPNGAPNLLKNYVHFESKNVRISEPYFDGDINSFETLKKLNIPFIVYFTSNTCSKCEKFSSIMDSYISAKNPFVFRVTGNENLLQITDIYKEIFYKNEEITVPYVGVFKNNSCTKIDNAKYMKTKNAFKNYMNSKFAISNVSFTSQKIEPSFRPNEFTYISYQTSSPDVVNLFREKFNFLEMTSKETIISNYEAKDLEISKYVFNSNNELEEKEKAQITRESEPQNIINFF